MEKQNNVIMLLIILLIVSMITDDNCKVEETSREILPFLAPIK